MRILYPDIVFGAIASSGMSALCYRIRVLTIRQAVTHAVIENWEYYDVIREAAESKCSKTLEDSISTIDSLLEVPFLAKRLKSLFGLSGLENVDFTSVLTVSSLFMQDLSFVLSLR